MAQPRVDPQGEHISPNCSLTEPGSSAEPAGVDEDGGLGVSWLGRRAVGADIGPATCTRHAPRDASITRSVMSTIGTVRWPRVVPKDADGLEALALPSGSRRVLGLAWARDYFKAHSRWPSQDQRADRPVARRHLDGCSPGPREGRAATLQGGSSLAKLLRRHGLKSRSPATRP